MEIESLLYVNVYLCLDGMISTIDRRGNSVVCFRLRLLLSMKTTDPAITAKEYIFYGRPRHSENCKRNAIVVTYLRCCYIKQLAAHSVQFYQIDCIISSVDFPRYHSQHPLPCSSGCTTTKNFILFEIQFYIPMLTFARCKQVWTHAVRELNNYLLI